ncbi:MULTISPECIES: DUF680 domain-containing protein [unclassified Mesorhizobium]|uniref:DUF680 domain-containing protein n=1 Tax=unclassified Mesorhizobium TaxID=325217 RepID=UPI0011293A9B|nr:MULTISPECIES: DUF680 domain-containing protein [unclassified Mesorhizobium]MBZ9704687.1 DUF680 domain-containing protein [Mesorhizobium sp. CO1-1-3]MBZ9950752.1 DUF680 domain-containing protein [Mesorhizobium sp. BR1-1-11]MBZ9985418.1 DUF680 domain-containing protein [Mesorhizobium sp. BR-1-1-8]TPI95410.1 DUF680 domain-containing protein [Mesorhizobium sp. B2-8-1]TPK57229.1 DUF680 domain-containing protein [Mesorhizobium sp. B2-5-1]
MKKIILAAAAVLAVSGSAFASSDNYGSNGANQPAVTSVDNAHTASIRDSGSPVYKLLNSSGDVHKSAPQGSDRNLFGH